MKAHIINIGDELLLGDTVNTNASWMSNELDKIGMNVARIVVIGDEETEIKNALSDALEEADLVLLTGGLGPTHDDITKHVLCEFFNDELVFNEVVLKDVQDLLDRFDKTMNELNKTQAMIPSRAEIIRNDRGTAPGMIFRKENRVVVSMPGVPHEMKNMMTKAVLPIYDEKNPSGLKSHRYLKIFGIAEASLAEMLETELDELPENIKTAFLPSPGHVKIRLSASSEGNEEISEEIDAQVYKFKKKIGDFFYGTENDVLEAIVGEMLTRLKRTVVSAESCTGGKLASKITSVPGSSTYYKGSVIAYSNDIKESILNVPPSLLEKYGAVSKEVVEAMAQGVKEAFDADYALSTSGIAGPDGGSAEKPVGTIWIGLSTPDGIYSKKLSLGFNRNVNINLTADYALDFLRKELNQTFEL